MKKRVIAVVLGIVLMFPAGSVHTFAQEPYVETEEVTETLQDVVQSEETEVSESGATEDQREEDDPAREPELTEGWTVIDVETFYYVESEPLTGEQKIAGKWYYFDLITGAMQTGIVRLSKKTVYYDESGCMYYGEVQVGNDWYYFKEVTGAMQTGFVTFSTGTVYYDEDGRRCTGEKKINGKWYFFDQKTGVMQTGIVDLPGKRVYYSADGSMLYGEQKINGKWYYFHTKTGAMQTGFVKLSSKTVYYDEDGTMYYGEKNIAGEWYYFKEVTGAMQTGFVTFPEGKRYYDESGRKCYGEKKVNGKWYYLDSETGVVQTGFVDLPGKRVYYSSNGSMLYGEQKINGKWYYFHPKTGAMQTGFVDLSTKRVYYFPDGTMAYGKIVDDGKTYYLKPGTGAMVKDAWYCLDGIYCYFGRDGVMKSEAPASKAINVNMIYQNPEFPNGCEAIALNNVLNYYGYSISKSAICYTYLPRGPLHSTSPYSAYMGDPGSATGGYGCWAPVIVKTARNYFNARGITSRMVRDITGSSTAELYQYVMEGKPVVIWATLGMGGTNWFLAGYANGKAVYWPARAHCMVLTGYDFNRQVIKVNDPIRGKVEYSMDAFEDAYFIMGKNAVLVE